MGDDESSDESVEPGDTVIELMQDSDELAPVIYTVPGGAAADREEQSESLHSGGDDVTQRSPRSV